MLRLGNFKLVLNEIFVLLLLNFFYKMQESRFLYFLRITTFVSFVKGIKMSWLLQMSCVRACVNTQRGKETFYRKSSLF